MTTDKVLKRITLFPKGSISLDEEGLMTYILPLGKLKYLPSVKKGMSFKVTEGGIKRSQAWTVDFTDVAETVKVSVTAERVDIVCSDDSTWDSFMEKANSVIDIVLRNNAGGMSRLAIGYTKRGKMEEEEIRESLHIDARDPVPASLREKTVKTVTVEDLDGLSEGVVLKYNDVHTLTYLREQGGWWSKNDYDINTVVDSDTKIVTAALRRFFEVGVEKLSSID